MILNPYNDLRDDDPPEVHGPECPHASHAGISDDELTEQINGKMPITGNDNETS
jgi:hypothetical protein